MKKLLHINIVLFVIYILSGCSTPKISEGVVRSDSDGKGGKAILLVGEYKTMEKQDLKKLLNIECKNYGKIVKYFTLLDSTKYTNIYTYRCVYSAEMQIKIDNYAKQKKIDERQKRIDESKKLAKIEEERLRRVALAKEKYEEELKKRSQTELEANKTKYENAKIECEAIGYKKGTDKFGECVLDLTE